MTDVFKLLTQGSTSSHRVPRHNTQNERFNINNEQYLTTKQHKQLLDALMNILYPHVRTRNSLVERYTRVAKDLGAYQATTGLEEQREKQVAQNISTSIPDQRYPLAEGHIEDIVTNLMQILFPARRMYGPSQTDPEKQNETSAFVNRMNIHAKNFSHYKVLGRVVHDAVAYNCGGFEIEWGNKTGWLSTKTDNIGLQGTNALLQSGNKVIYCDLFNTIWDYSVKPEEYAYNAQFHAKIEPVGEYQLKLMLANGLLYGPKSMQNYLRKLDWKNGLPELAEHNAKNFYVDYHQNLGLATNNVHGSFNSGLYCHRPQIRSKWFYMNKHEDGYHSQNREFDVNSYMCDDSHHEYSEFEHPYTNEIITMKVRIVPADYALGTSKEMQIWEFKILNGNWIVSAMQVGTAHGLMPVVRCVPKTEHGELQSKSYGEKLTPFQDLISNISNLYLKGMRKNTNNGLIFYDQNSVKLAQHADPTSGYIPVDVGQDKQGRNIPIGNSVHVVHERPEINTSINDIAQIHSLMQDVMPTDLMENMANLNRATEHQSQTVTNAASRRLYKLARDISDDAIVPAMYMMTQNTIHLEEPFETMDGEGNKVLLDPSSFADEGIELGVSDGLRGIDQVAIERTLGDVIQTILQSPQANSEINVVKLLEYKLQGMGADIDIEQFKFRNGFDALPPDQKQIAFQLFQQAAQAQQEQQQ